MSCSKMKQVKAIRQINPEANGNAWFVSKLVKGQ